MSLGWYLNEPLVLLLVPKLMTCLQELGDILEGGQCTQLMEADQVETEEETVVVVPPVEEEVHGEVEDTREVEAQAQRLVLMLAVLGPESFVYVHYAGVLDLNLVPNLACRLPSELYRLSWDDQLWVLIVLVGPEDFVMLVVLVQEPDNPFLPTNC